MSPPSVARKYRQRCRSASAASVSDMSSAAKSSMSRSSMRADNDFGSGESSRTRLADGEEGLGETNPPECTIIGSSRPTETFADFGRPDRKGPQQPNFRWKMGLTPRCGSRPLRPGTGFGFYCSELACWLKQLLISRSAASQDVARSGKKHAPARCHASNERLLHHFGRRWPDLFKRSSNRRFAQPTSS